MAGVSSIAYGETPGPPVPTLNLPEKTGSYNVNSWVVRFVESHILHSKCAKKGDCKEKEECDWCQYCVFNRCLTLPHLPDMVFHENILSVLHEREFGLKFTALEALKLVDTRVGPQVSCSVAWREARQDSKYLEIVKPFDWTFCTTYCGTLIGDLSVEETEEKLDIEKLKQTDDILFYQEVTLFEDELHDHGCAVCSVKIRVMPTFYFILLRYFLRIDNVLIRAHETRYFHEFNSAYILREVCSKEDKMANINVSYSQLTNANLVCQLLPVTSCRYEKIIFPQT